MPRETANQREVPVNFLEAKLGAQLRAKGFDAAAIVRSTAPRIKGGGGGRADLAQAGGSDVSGLDGALAEAAQLALERLQSLETA